MPKLIIIRGNSGSGKTSVANALQKRLGHNTLLLSQDVIRREMLWVNDGVDTPALPLLTNLLQYGKEHCEYTILEGILNSSWYLPLFQYAIKEFSPYIYAYYYDIPFDETLSRHNTRAKRLEFGESEMRRWWNEKDYIDFISETIIHADVSLSDAVEMIYQSTTAE